MQRLLIIIASTRPGRRGAAVAEWFAGEARAHGGFELSVADLAELDLPLLDEPNDSVRDAYVHAHTKRWSRIVDTADAFVIVTPEYNNSFPAALKNALDYLYREWRYKPVGLVSYGGVSGGLRAATAIKPVFAALSLIPVEDAVVVRDVKQHVLDGRLAGSDSQRRSAEGMLDELSRMSAALEPLRGAVVA